MKKVFSSTNGLVTKRRGKKLEIPEVYNNEKKSYNQKHKREKKSYDQEDKKEEKIYNKEDIKKKEERLQNKILLMN